MIEVVIGLDKDKNNPIVTIDFELCAIFYRIGKMRRNVIKKLIQLLQRKDELNATFPNMKIIIADIVYLKKTMVGNHCLTGRFT